MIRELAINDLGVITQASVPLGPGFTVLTGETGAGKTMVVTRARAFRWVNVPRPPACARVPTPPGWRATLRWGLSLR